MASDFLKQEYDQCFEQLRYYDTRQEEILKYLVTLSTAVTTAVFAVFKAIGSTTSSFFSVLAFLSILVFVASVLLYIMMLRNRLYFVFVARQLNAIRKFMLTTEATTFVDNQLYTSTNFTAFKWMSMHCLQMFGVSFISSMFAAASVFSISCYWELNGTVSASLLAFFVVGAIEVISGATFLKGTNAKTSDEVIHPVLK